jgi:hypothetical protein
MARRSRCPVVLLTSGEVGSRSAASSSSPVASWWRAGDGGEMRWRLHLPPVRRGDLARGARRAPYLRCPAPLPGGLLFIPSGAMDGVGGTAATTSSSSQQPPLHPLRRSGRRWQRAVVGRQWPTLGPTLWFFVFLLKNSFPRV